MQQSRRTTPYPYTWEIPLTATITVVLTLVLAAHTARTLANVFAGAGSVKSSAGTYTAWKEVIDPFFVDVIRSCKIPISWLSVG